MKECFDSHFQDVMDSITEGRKQYLSDMDDYIEKIKSIRISRAKHYFLTHPDCDKLVESYGSYPATPDGKCLCAMEAGYTNECNAGEGFFDCRDCWSTTYEDI